MTDYTNITREASQYVESLFEESKPLNLFFHNLRHTQTVVERSEEIGLFYKLPEKDMMLLLVAAWFHDTGYLFVEHAIHEEKSVDLMLDFIKPFQLPGDLVNEIEGCILSTRIPRNPNGMLQEIICDADTYHFGTTEFQQTNVQIFKELQHQKRCELTQLAFDETAMDMLKHHHFYTRYCRDLLNPGKKTNMKKLKKKIKNDDYNEETDHDEEFLITEKDGTTKGMQTMLRLTSSNHIQLSEMADSKANILISVNAIIISVILSVLLRKLQTDPYLTIPTIVFLTFSVVTIVISILATRPKLNTGTFVEEDIVNKKTNLLFFGNFHKMSLENYEKAMKMMMKDSDYLYSSIVQDIYHLGVVLGKKYRLIRLAYNVFMIGIIVSVIAFALAALFNTEPPPVTIINGNSGGSPF
ncbi:MAG TPA: DUF5706 domain-containing protein [Ferruginibacter sp.]|nr:DUF5706 domain-containing protein [Ferruginibacter sp.]